MFLLLALDIGNSRISVGVFSLEDNALCHAFHLAADKAKSADEYSAQICSILALRGIQKDRLRAAILSSVVPSLTHTLKKVAKLLTGNEPLIVGAGIKTGFPIRIDTPSELGSDLVANTAGVLADMGNKRIAAIVVDVGTATTISAINASHEYVGNCIASGIGLSLETLHSQTALLPSVTLSAPKCIIGKNSFDSMRSGILLGNALMIDAFIDKFAGEMRLGEGLYDVYITGGFAELLLPSLTHRVIYEPHLTLIGLYHLYQNNTDR